MEGDNKWTTLRETGNSEHKRENEDKLDKTRIQKTTKRSSNGNYKNNGVKPGAHESFFCNLSIAKKKQRQIQIQIQKHMTCIYNFT